MTLNEIQHIAEISNTYDLDFPSQMDEWCEKVYSPVRKAIANNDKTVIDYISNYDTKDKYNLFTPVEDGALDGQHPEAIALCVKLCNELNVRVDDRLMLNKIAV